MLKVDKMNKFDDIDFMPREEQPVDPYAPIKIRMVQGLNRSDKIRSMVQEWIVSFRGGITKSAYESQIKRLDFDDNIAETQLAKAIGKRTIPLPPPPKKPCLNTSLLEKMVEEHYVGVYGKGFKKEIKNLVSQLRECGTVYVLEIEKLCLEFSSYENKGKSPEMIKDAVESDFLIITDLEMPIHLEWHIREAIERIGRIREEHHKPIVSTWCRFNDCNAFFERFHVYYVK